MKTIKFLKFTLLFLAFFNGSLLSADLLIQKSASVSLINESADMSYNLVVTNTNSSASATNPVVQDTLPAEMTFVSASYVNSDPSKGDVWSCTTTGTPTVVTCSSSIAYKGGDYTTLTLNVKAPTSTAAGEVIFDNTASVTSDDLNGSVSNTVSIKLNRAPTAVNDTMATTSHTPISGNVLNNDSDLDGDILSITSTGSYTLNYGEITIYSNGDFTYSPGYFSGVTDTFTYTVTDTNGASSEAMLSISIDSGCLDTGVTNSERSFCLRKQTVIFGDMLTVGNTVLVPPTSETCTNYTTGAYYTDTTTSNALTTLCDYKPDSLTNASSAEVILPVGSTVAWAGLYIQSVIDKDDLSDLSSLDIKIKNGTSPYVSVGSPVVLNHKEHASDYNSYSAFFDLTSTLKSNNWKGGIYTVGNIPHTEDTYLSGLGKYGAWSLVVIYENTNETLKSVSIYDGWKVISSTNPDVDVSIENFYTPANGDIAATLSVFTAEGDKGISGDRLKSGTTNIGNPTDNAFSSKIVTSGTRVPELINNQGIDIQTYDIGTSGLDLLAHNDNNITFTFTSTGDTYFPSMLSFSTEVYSPKMCYYEGIYDSSGTLLSEGGLVSKGSVLSAKVLLKNDKNEPAEKVSVYRQFDTTMPYVADSTAVNNTPTATMSSTTTSVTDILDADTFEYTVGDLFSLQIGTDATSDQGGNFDYNQTAVFDYDFIADFDGNTSITYQIAYTMPSIGFKYNGELAKCEDFNTSFGTLYEQVVSAAADVIDTSITSAFLSTAYNTSTDTSSSGLKFIKTKRSGETVPLTGVYIDENGLNNDYDNSGQDTDKALWFAIPVLNDINITGGCPAADSSQLQQLIDPNTGLQAVMQLRDLGASDYSTTLDVIIPANATKNAKIEFIVVDSSKLNADAQNCIAVSSTTGNLEGLGQCVNSEVHYVDAYGQTAYDRCLVNSTYGQPCLSSRGGVGTGVFNTTLGCLMCTFYAGTECSTDDFSIRPERLAITSTDPNMPDLLRSAEEYNTTIHAYNYTSTTHTLNYNVPNANGVFDINTTKYNKNDIIDLSMNGTTSFAPVSFDMLNGLSVKTGVIGNEVVSMSFDDVGKTTLHLEDQTWAAIDNDDTPMSCDDDGTYICGDVNTTYIPHHFDFNGSSIVNNDGNPGTFTYLANERDQMAARINANVRALNKDNNLTQNFSAFPLYENPVSITPVVAKPTYIYPDANESTFTDLTLGFASGVKALSGFDTNNSLNLMFNFQRDLNLEMNPFMVTGNDLNITLTSNYTGTAPAGTAVIQGDANMSMDGNATFIYGRTNAPRQRISGNTGTAFIYYEAHCSGVDASGVTCDKAFLPNNVGSISTDDPRWFRNQLHSTTNSGVVGTISQKNGLTTVGSTAATGNNPDSTQLTYDQSRGYPYKTTMENNASAWLIYNKFDTTNTDTTNEFEVEFENPNSSWAGVHETNTTTDSNAASKTNRRSMW